MPNIYTVASLLYQLYNMVTIFGLHNFRNLLRVIQVKRDIGKLRHQIAFAHEAHFSSHHGRSPIFGIKNRKSREISLAFIYLFAEITQSSFHIIYFLLRNLRIQSNNRPAIDYKTYAPRPVWFLHLLPNSVVLPVRFPDHELHSPTLHEFRLPVF